MERPLSIVFKSFSGFAAFTKSIRLKKITSEILIFKIHEAETLEEVNKQFDTL